MQPVITPDSSGSLSIWDHPQERVEYVIGIDPAENKRRDRTAIERRTKVVYSSERPDYSAAIVLELVSGLHVASWHGYCPPDEMATMMAALGMYYNTALLVPEINGPGIAVVTRLTETFRYENVYRTPIFNVMDRDPWQPQWGFRTDAMTRKVLMMRVSEAINSHQLWTRDRELIQELRTMEFDDQGRERARGKNKDDRVFALALALQGRYDQVGQLSTDPREKRSSERAYDDMVWKKIEQKLEETKRGTTGNRDSGWSRPPWSGRPRR